MQKRKPSKGDFRVLGFLRYLLIPCLLLLLPSCSIQSAKEEGFTPFPNDLRAKEAPMLAKLVAEGKLPPLEKRLPKEPLVVKPLERPGRYGGTWRMMHDNPDLGMVKMILGYTPLMRWRFDCQGIEPGLAKSWEFNKDGTVLTIHLREGVKWSDGVEYTSEDIAFWYELCKDPRYYLEPPFWCLVNGKAMELETPDKYTVVMKFAGPNWFVPLHLATGFWWCDEYNIPKHYMKQFHPDYNPKYKDFTVFQQKNLSHANPERPTLWPWRVVRYDMGGYRVVLERNPYFWAVDTLGRQLPYIDRVESVLVPEPQLRVLKVLAGEIDCQFRLLELRDLALYLRGRKRGNYRVLRWKSASGAETAVLVNWSPPDPMLRKLVRDQRFRRALALGIDRQKCALVAWRGLATPQSATVSQEAWHFQDPEGRKLFLKWKESYTEFNLQKANRLLDEMGLTRRDAEGYRLLPNGQRLRIVMDAPSAQMQSQENDEALIIAENWRKMGIEVVIHTPPPTEYSNRQRLGKFTISMHGAAEMDLFTYPDWVFPTTSRYWHPLEGRWYETGGKEGLAPSGPMKKLLDIYERIKHEPNLERAHRLVQEAVRIHIREGPFCLGTAAQTPVIVIVKNNFHNVPSTGILGPWAIAQPATSYPEQYFIE